MSNAGRYHSEYRNIKTQPEFTVGKHKTAMCPRQSNYLRYRQLGSTFNNFRDGLHIVDKTYRGNHHVPIDDFVIRPRVEIADVYIYLYNQTHTPSITYRRI